MCWNPQISLSTFIFGCAAIVIGYINGVNDLWWSVFWLSFVSMQLLEYFMWTHLDNPRVNRALSICGLALILAQPLFAGLLISDRHAWMWYTALYIPWVVVYLATSAPFVFKTVRAKNKHLGWLWMRPGHWILAIMWLAFVCTAVWLSAATKAMKLAIIAATGLMAVSWWFYKFQEHSWGSVFCSFANVLFVFVLVKSFGRQYCTLR